MADNGGAAVAAGTGEVLVSKEGAVGVVRIDRPKALNALSAAVIEGVMGALEAFDRDPEIRVMVLAGGEKAFAAGADIKELEEASIAGFLKGRAMERWAAIRAVAKPVIAAVNGFALGGGCELALSCDIIVAGEDAVFAQPEIDLGVIPGAGGTQRLTRALGKAVAMDMVLTGRRMSAAEAHRLGLVSRVTPAESCFDEAMRLAREIAAKPPLAALAAKEAVTRALDADLETGLAHERKLFYLLFGTADQKEGMRAFREKRAPAFRGE